MKKILIVVAHPDDEVLGMGGSIARFAAEGKEVHLLIVTDGSSSQYKDSDELERIIKQKKKETAKVADLLGIASVHYGNLPDMRLDVTPHVEVNEVIERMIDQLAPDTVFTHFWGDVNKDHRCVFESVLVAARPTRGQSVRELYCFHVPSSTEWMPNKTDTAFMPNFYVNIGRYCEKKYEAMAAYQTEVREYPHPRSVRHLAETDTVEGLKVGMDATESFVALRLLID